MKRVIVEAPFGQDPDVLGKYLIECIRDSLRRGEAPIASVATFALSGALVEAKPEERQQGMRAGWAWYAGAELCAVYSDWGTSLGVMEGVVQAKHHGVPVEYRMLYGPKTGGDRG